MVACQLLAQDRISNEKNLNQFIDEAEKIKQNPNPSSIHKIIDEAISSGRVEFMTVCFKKFGNTGAFKEKLSALPPSTFKNKVVLSILQEPWTFDQPFAGSRPYPAMHRICMEVMNGYLPAENLSSDNEAAVDRMDQYSTRLVLANRFRAALEAAGEIEPTSRPDRRPPPFERAAEPDPALSSSSNDSRETGSNQKIPLEKKIPPLLAAAAGILFLVWIISRKFSHAGNTQSR